MVSLPFFCFCFGRSNNYLFSVSVSVGATMVQACNINFMWSELLLMHVSSPRRRSISTRQLILHACIRLWGCLTHWALVSSNPMKRESKNTTPPPCSPSCFQSYFPMSIIQKIVEISWFDISVMKFHSIVYLFDLLSCQVKGIITYCHI